MNQIFIGHWCATSFQLSHPPTCSSGSVQVINPPSSIQYGNTPTTKYIVIAERSDRDRVTKRKWGQRSDRYPHIFLEAQPCAHLHRAAGKSHTINSRRVGNNRAIDDDNLIGWQSEAGMIGCIIRI